MSATVAVRTSPRDERPLGVAYRRDGHDYSLCLRCGIERRVQSSRPAGLCSDCRSVVGRTNPWRNA